MLAKDGGDEPGVFAGGSGEEGDEMVGDHEALGFCFGEEVVFIEPIGHDGAGADVVGGGVKGVVEEEEGGVHFGSLLDDLPEQVIALHVGELAAVFVDEFPEGLALGDGEEVAFWVCEEGVGELLVEDAWGEAAGVEGFYGLAFVGHGITDLLRGHG